jgi:hypothetical protein
MQRGVAMDMGKHGMKIKVFLGLGVFLLTCLTIASAQAADAKAVDAKADVKTLADEPTSRVVFDREVRLPGWETRGTEGAIKGEEKDGVEFTIEAWREGRDMWPRLLYTGDGIDLSAYSRLVFEIENPSDIANSVIVAARSVPEDNAGLAMQLPPQTTTSVSLDIADGALLDQSAVREMYVLQYLPLTASTYRLKKITAVKNPDFISKRAALSAQIGDTQRNFEVLKQSASKDDKTEQTLGGIETRLKALSDEFDARQMGYAVPVQKTLIEAQTGIARTGMDSRVANLWLWSAPLGVALREGTLPSPADSLLTALQDTVCLNQYRALCLNISAAEQAQTVQVKLAAPDGQPNLVSLRPTEFVKARDGSMVADAIGVAAKELTVEVPSYQSQQVIVWIDTKQAAARAGRFKATIEVTSGAEGKTRHTIPLEIIVADVKLASTLPFSSSNWAYFYMGSTKATEGLEKEAVANLRDYGMNTWNMDYSQVPMPLLDAKGKYAGLEPNVLAQMKKLMELLQGHPDEPFVVWLGFQRPAIREALKQPGVLEGYLKDLQAVLDEHKVPQDKRYIMLWDEPKLPELRETVEWFKKIQKLSPHFKLYDNGTAIPPDFKEFEEFVTVTDRWFPNWDQLFVSRPELAQKISAMNIPKTGYYRCLMSRNNWGVNIYEYYRLMGWYVMQHGFETFAFWVHNVGDSTEWDGTTGTMSGGSMVYQKEGKLFTSRRWEMVREGFEDYKIAQAAVGSAGIVDARKHAELRQICEAVAAHTTDAAYADTMRVKLIQMALRQQ